VKKCETEGSQFNLAAVVVETVFKTFVV